MRQHRLDPPRDVGRVGPAVGLRLERAAGPHVRGDVGDVDPEPTPLSVREAETASSKSWALAGSTVKVARSRSGRGARPKRAGLGGDPRCLGLEPAGEAAADAALSHQRLDHVGRPPRIAELSSTWRARRAELDQSHPSRGGRSGPPPSSIRPAALEQGLADQEAAALGDQDHAPSRRRGLIALVRARKEAPRCCSASRGLRRPASSRPVASLTSGLIPTAVDRVAVARQVLAHGQVEGAAVLQLDHLLEAALAEGASRRRRSPSRRRPSAAVRISEAEAVSPLIRTTIGRSGRASPTASKVCLGEVRALVETITPSRRRCWRRASPSQQPAAVAAQVEYQSLGPPARQSRSTSLRSWAWAPLEKLRSRT